MLTCSARDAFCDPVLVDTIERTRVFFRRVGKMAPVSSILLVAVATRAATTPTTGAAAGPEPQPGATREGSRGTTEGAEGATSGLVRAGVRWVPFTAVRCSTTDTALGTRPRPVRLLSRPARASKVVSKGQQTTSWEPKLRAVGQSGFDKKSMSERKCCHRRDRHWHDTGVKVPRGNRGSAFEDPANAPVGDTVQAPYPFVLLNLEELPSCSNVNRGPDLRIGAVRRCRSLPASQTTLHILGSVWLVVLYGQVSCPEK